MKDKYEGNYECMRIAMIGHKRVPSREGGIEIVVEELSKRLAVAGHTVHVYNRKGGHVSGKGFIGASDSINLNEYKGIKFFTIFTFENKVLNAFIYSVFSTVYALFRHYDCIHYHAEGPCAMLWIPHLFGIRTVATIHGLDWQRAKWGGFASKYIKFGEKIAAKYADEVIVLSKNIQKYFFDTYRREVNFIPNGVNKLEVKKGDVIYKKWGLKKDEYILFLGRVVPEKGVSYLINAYKGLKTSFKLVIAGGGSHSNNYIEQIKIEAGDSSRIIFTDFVQGEELEELFSNAYLYVLPSDLEGMPLSLLEAMSYGNCCIVSNIPECAEVVEDMAVIFNKSDVSDLSNKLEFLLENPNIVMKYKSMSSSFICKKYDWDSVINRTIELYKKG